MDTMQYSFIHRSDNSTTRRTLTPLSCQVVKNNINIFLFTLFIEYMCPHAQYITVKTNKINGFCGLDFVAWISFAAWNLVL